MKPACGGKGYRAGAMIHRERARVWGKNVLRKSDGKDEGSITPEEDG